MFPDCIAQFFSFSVVDTLRVTVHQHFLAINVVIKLEKQIRNNYYKRTKSAHLLQQLYSCRSVGVREKFHDTGNDSLLIFVRFEEFTNLGF